MSNQIYPKGGEKILQGQVDFFTENIHAALLPPAYNFNQAHEFAAQLGTLIGTVKLNNVSIFNGVFDADDADFGTIEAGKILNSVAIYKDTGDAATSPLLFFFDTIQGFPITTTGNPFILPWSNEEDKIVRLKPPFYPKAGEHILNGMIDFMTDNIKVALLPTAYQYHAAHAYLTDVGGAANLIGNPVELVNRTISQATFNAGHVDFGNIPSGANVGSAVIYKDSGSDSNSPLLLHVGNLYGVPFATNGGLVTLQWATDSAKIVTLLNN